jgi:hypothetical protein
MLLGIAVLMLGLLLIPVGGCAPAPTTSPTAPGVWEWPPTFSIATAYVGSSSYISTAAWAPLLEEASGMSVRVVPEDSEPIKARWCKTETVDLWSDGIYPYRDVVEGRSGHVTRDGGPFPLAMAWQNNVTWMSCFVRADSDIKTIYDIKPGTRIADWTALTAWMEHFDMVFELAEIDKEDLVLCPFGSYQAAVMSVPEGKADVTWVIPSAGVAYEAAASPHGIRFLDLTPRDEEAMRRVMALNPIAKFTPVKYGVKESLDVGSVYQPFVYYIRSDTDPELVYRYAKWMDENYDAYKGKFEGCETLSIEDLRDFLDVVCFIPIHDGTVKYLKEKGMWTADDTTMRDWSIELQDRYIEAYEAAIATADEKGIKVRPDNEEWVELWESYKTNIPLVGTTTK